MNKLENHLLGIMQKYCLKYEAEWKRYISCICQTDSVGGRYQILKSWQVSSQMMPYQRNMMTYKIHLLLDLSAKWRKKIWLKNGNSRSSGSTQWLNFYTNTGRTQSDWPFIPAQATHIDWPFILTLAGTQWLTFYTNIGRIQSEWPFIPSQATHSDWPFIPAHAAHSNKPYTNTGRTQWFTLYTSTDRTQW